MGVGTEKVLVGTWLLCVAAAPLWPLVLGSFLGSLQRGPVLLLNKSPLLDPVSVFHSSVFQFNKTFLFFFLAILLRINHFARFLTKRAAATTAFN